MNFEDKFYSRYIAPQNLEAVSSVSVSVQYYCIEEKFASVAIDDM